LNGYPYPPGMPPAARAAAEAARAAQLLSRDGLGDVAVSRQGAMAHDPYTTRNAVAPKWLTWGQQASLPFVLVGAGEGTVPFQQSTQLVRVDYHMPTTWRSKVLFDFSGLPPFPTGQEISVGYSLTLGVGQASITQVFNVTSTANAAGLFPQVVDDETFPAQSIQMAGWVNPFVSSSGVPIVDGSITMIAMVSPMVF